MKSSICLPITCRTFSRSCIPSSAVSPCVTESGPGQVEKHIVTSSTSPIIHPAPLPLSSPFSNVWMSPSSLRNSTSSMTTVYSSTRKMSRVVRKSDTALPAHCSTFFSLSSFFISLFMSSPPSSSSSPAGSTTVKRARKGRAKPRFKRNAYTASTPTISSANVPPAASPEILCLISHPPLRSRR
ncbi:unnamed protein product [Periconia digitata]|uniref:Uncharacterized protein n=1 Tax=Periconia digitata TaxID=1303443 RepID=A0A9W4UNW5_9PLEO|nr:unnamed protein product [Periconia digitata]